MDGALLFLLFIALGGYALISYGAVLVLDHWVKSLENGTDYSFQSTMIHTVQKESIPTFISDPASAQTCKY